VFVGSALTVARICRCNPWAKGGVDDVPRRRLRRYRLTSWGFVTNQDPAATAVTGSASPVSVAHAHTQRRDLIESAVSFSHGKG
jgi:hypothetical protein